MNSAFESELFLGRTSELTRLCAAIRDRKSLLIWGARGSGKTTLIAHALARLPKQVAKESIFASGQASPQEILTSLAVQLAGAPLLLSKFRAETAFGGSYTHWVRQQTSLRLRGLIYRVASAGDYWMFLEDLEPMTHMLTRIVKELMINRETPIYCVATGCTSTELGCASQLYWNDEQRLHVGELPLSAATELIEWAIQRFGLSRLDLDGFREDILKFSGLLPGAILRMCESAGDPRYQFEGRIKTKLVHVDYLVNQCKGIASHGGGHCESRQHN
jgi:energy-coupling factor transporter ATP-binding protein EcfA2